MNTRLLAAPFFSFSPPPQITTGVAERGGEHNSSEMRVEIWTGELYRW